MSKVPVEVEAPSGGPRRRSRRARASRAGWRLVVDCIDSRARVDHARRRARSSSAASADAAAAPRGRASSRSRRPSAEGTMRTRSGGRPRTRGGVGAVHVGRLGAGVDLDALARPARRRRPRARYRRARRSAVSTVASATVRGAARAASASPRADQAAGQQVAGAVGVEERRARRPRPRRVSRAGSGRQATGKLGEVERGDGLGRAGDGGDRLAAEAGRAVRPAPAGRRRPG